MTERKEAVRLREALRAFVNTRDQFPESIKLIQPKLNELTPITVTVTKGQFAEAVAALAEADTGRPLGDGDE